MAAQRQPTQHWISYINSLLRYYLGVEPEALSDAEWTESYAHLAHIRKEEAAQWHR